MWIFKMVTNMILPLKYIDWLFSQSFGLYYNILDINMLYSLS